MSTLTVIPKLILMLAVLFGLMVGGCTPKEKTHYKDKIVYKDRPTKGGGDFGGGNLQLNEVEMDIVVKAIRRADKMMPYYFNFIDCWRYLGCQSKGQEDGDSQVRISMELMSEDDRQSFASAQSKIFAGEENIYHQLVQNKIEILEDGQCKSSHGVSKDGSAIQPGVVCLDKQRIQEKIKDVHAYSSIVGLVAHEYVHKVKGTTEAEAQAVEKLFALNIKDDVDSDDILEARKSLEILEESIGLAIQNIAGEKGLSQEQLEETHWGLAGSSVTCQYLNYIQFGKGHPHYYDIYPIFNAQFMSLVRGNRAEAYRSFQLVPFFLLTIDCHVGGGKLDIGNLPEKDSTFDAKYFRKDREELPDLDFGYSIFYVEDNHLEGIINNLKEYRRLVQDMILDVNEGL